MEDEIPGVMIPKIFNTPERLVPTLGMEGYRAVNESDLRKWLEFNQHERPPGSGPNGEWTVGDEEAAMQNYNSEMDFGDRPPYDVLADTLIDQDYDFSPEGEEARKAESPETSYTIDDEREALESREYPAMLPQADAQEKMSLYLKSRKRTEGAAKKAMSGGHPEGYIVHPDGFTEYFEDPAVTAQAKKDTQQSAAQYRLNQMKDNLPKGDVDGREEKQGQ